jgi:hypothetical protein
MDAEMGEAEPIEFSAAHEVWRQAVQKEVHEIDTLPCVQGTVRFTASDKTSDNKVVVKLKLSAQLSALGQALAESTVSKHRLSPTPRRTNNYNKPPNGRAPR